MNFWHTTTTSSYISHYTTVTIDGIDYTNWSGGIKSKSIYKSILRKHKISRIFNIE
jgi:hypothetical protein